jgi:hypothetical protein
MGPGQDDQCLAHRHTEPQLLGSLWERHCFHKAFPRVQRACTPISSTYTNAVNIVWGTQLRSQTYRVSCRIALACILLVPFMRAQSEVTSSDSRPEEIEWTWEVRPANVDRTLPNVLLVGDSITRNYYPEVQRELIHTANVYLFATSASVGDPRLIQQLAEFGSLQATSFRVVHFNNGMHGWNYSEAEYKHGFPSFVNALHALATNANFVWASITPVRDEILPGPTNTRIEARNNIAQDFFRGSDVIVDDQHLLMSRNPGHYADGVHFNPVGAVTQGEQVSSLIRAVLLKR